MPRTLVQQDRRGAASALRVVRIEIGIAIDIGAIGEWLGDDLDFGSDPDFDPDEVRQRQRHRQRHRHRQRAEPLIT